MAIPDFQTIMLPLLVHLSDGEIHVNKETFESLANQFGLTDEEKRQLLPSGQQGTFTNRIAWAKTHLKVAGLIESPKRAHYRITDKGRRLLDSNPEFVNLKLLRQYPEYDHFRQPKRDEIETTAVDDVISADNEMTPQEHIEHGYSQLRADLAAELLSSIAACSPEFFERLVVDLLVAMGYGGSLKDAGSTIGKSGDGGIDGLIKEDRLGLDIIYIQAKRWEGTVSRPEIQKFAGALQGQRAKKGVFITTSGFSKGAREYVSKIESKIVLIDGERLADLMIDYGIGVSTIANYHIKRLDSDYFEA